MEDYIILELPVSETKLDEQKIGEQKIEEQKINKQEMEEIIKEIQNLKFKFKTDDIIEKILKKY